MSSLTTFPFRNWLPSILDWPDESILHAQSMIRYDSITEGPVAHCDPGIIALDMRPELKFDIQYRPCLSCLWKLKKIEQIFGEHDVIDPEGRYEARDESDRKRIACLVCKRRTWKQGPLSRRICDRCERYELGRIADANRRSKALREAQGVTDSDQPDAPLAG